MKWRTCALVFVVNTVGGCLPATFIWLLNPDWTVATWLHQVRYGLAYAWSIGILGFFFMERTARAIRCGLPRFLHIPALVASFVLMAVVGSIPASLSFVLFKWISWSEVWPAYRRGLGVAILI